MKPPTPTGDAVAHLIDFINRHGSKHASLADTCVSYLRMFPARAAALIAILIKPYTE